MLKVKHRALTVHDYMQLPEDPSRKWELIEGEIHVSPAPNRLHQTIVKNLIFLLEMHLKRHPIGKVFVSPFDVLLTDINAYQPDVCYFSKARYTSLTEQGADGAPELVVEVLSARSAKHDLGVKKEIYARTGVEEFWSVDPVKRTVTVFELDESTTTPRATLSEGKTLTTPLLPGLKIKIRDVFAE